MDALGTAPAGCDKKKQKASVRIASNQKRSICKGSVVETLW